MKATRQLRVQPGALDVAADGRSVHLQARWSVADPLGTTPPRLGQAAFQPVAAAGSDAEALAAAHRQALWLTGPAHAVSALTGFQALHKRSARVQLAQRLRLGQCVAKANRHRPLSEFASTPAQ